MRSLLTVLTLNAVVAYQAMISVLAIKVSVSNGGGAPRAFFQQADVSGSCSCWLFVAISLYSKTYRTKKSLTFSKFRLC